MTRTIVLIIILLLLTSLSFADARITAQDTYGTWSNSDYNVKAPYAKIIVNPDGSIKRFQTVTDTEPKCQGTYTVNDNWYDSTGNLWIKFDYKTTGGRTFHVLSKHSESGTVWEWVSSEIKYPTEMSPIAGNYAIYYRHE